MGIGCARIGVPIAQQGSQNQEWCGEVQNRPGKEGDVAVIEAIPVQEGRNAHKCGKRGDRKEANLDPVPVCKGRSTHKKVGPSNVSRSQHHGCHPRSDGPGKQFPCVIRQQVENTESNH